MLRSYVPWSRVCGDDSDQHADLACSRRNRHAARLHKPRQLGAERTRQESIVRECIYFPRTQRRID
jgi:hypothetical protein